MLFSRRARISSAGDIVFTRCRLAILLAVALGAAQHTIAATMVGAAYEPFNYTAGTQMTAANNLNGGVGWNNTGDISAPNAANTNWANAAALPGPSGASTNPGKTIGGSSLSYSAVGYAPSNAGKAVVDAVAGGGTTNVSRFMSQLVDSGPFYFSYLTDKNNDTLRTTSLTFFGPSNGMAGTPGNSAERFAIGQIGTTGATGTPAVPNAQTDGNIGVFFNNNQPTGVVNAANPIAYGVGVTHLIIGRVDWNASGNETVTIWVDPTDVTSEAAAGTPYLTNSGFELTSFNSVRLFAGNTAAAANGFPARPAVSADFDEIRIGSTWGDVTTVVPEPSTIMLMLVSVVTFVGLRRTRVA
jgi:hypothetical protein